MTKLYLQYNEDKVLWLNSHDIRDLGVFTAHLSYLDGYFSYIIAMDLLYSSFIRVHYFIC